MGLAEEVAGAVVLKNEVTNFKKGLNLEMKKYVTKCVSMTVMVALVFMMSITGVFGASNEDYATLKENSNSIAIDLQDTIEGVNVLNQESLNVTSTHVSDVYEQTISNGMLIAQEEENGVTWTVIKNSDSSVSAINEATKEITNVFYDKEEGLLFIEKFVKNGSNYIEETASIEIQDVLNIDSIQGQAISYGSKVKETYKNKYWYQVGHDGTKDYLKIGCVATYRLRTDTMSASRYDSCKDYKTGVKNCRDYYNKYKSAVSDAGLSVELVTAIIVANILSPVGIIVDVVIAAVGSASIPLIVRAVDAYMSATDAYDDAKTSYEEIKVWGTKL